MTAKTNKSKSEKQIPPLRCGMTNKKSEKQEQAKAKYGDSGFARMTTSLGFARMTVEVS
jgi:hypothetical protein